jgi:hypothetical protein
MSSKFNTIYTSDPVTKYGTQVKDYINSTAYTKMKMEFRILEKAIVQLRLKTGNKIKFVLIEPFLGWQSDGMQDKLLPHFYDLVEKGMCSSIRIYVYTDEAMGRAQSTLDFFKCIEENKPKDLAIIWEGQPMEDMKWENDANGPI